MASYVIEVNAWRDIRQITGYISSENPHAADRMYDALMKACEIIGKNPYIGQERVDLTRKPVRFWVVSRNYMIIYNANSKPVQILRVYNAARDIASILH